MTLPWAPLFTTTRSGLPEVTVHGIVAVWDPALGTILEAGDISAPLWMRSLLKPWQLLVILPELMKKHPDLEPEQLAIMLSSQQGDKQQLEILRDLLDLGNLKSTDLKCPAALPMGEKKVSDVTPSPVFHPCSGKHLGYLLAGKDPETYLQPGDPAYQELKKVIRELLERKEFFPETMDGCGMPNFAVSANEMARLYWVLSKDVALEGYDAHWHTLRDVMRAHPLVVGGEGRLDSRLMMGEFTATPLIAKEGADGLLGVNVAATEQYPAGLGILIKLAHGWYPEHLEMIITEVLAQLGLKESRVLPFRQVLKTQFHFSVSRHARII